MSEVDLRSRLPRDLTWVAGLGLTLLTFQIVHQTRWAVDAHAYWDAWRGSMYDGVPNSVDAYLYSPAFAQVIWPLAQLPWPVFGLVWCLAATSAYLYLFLPLGWRWALPLTLCCTPDILIGNIFWLLALVAAFGLRRPALWAVPALTKITPALGPVWFLVRREWRALAISAAATAVVAGLSFAVDPGLWAGWFTFLHHNSGQNDRGVSLVVPPLLVRLPVAVVVVAWCARTDRRWGLPAGMILATPAFGVAAFTVLAALPRLAARENEPEGPTNASDVRP